MKKMSSMKRFLKVDQVEESQDYGTASLPMNKLAQEGAILLPMQVSRIWCMWVSMNFEDAMFEDEIEYDAHYIGAMDSLSVVGAFICP